MGDKYKHTRAQARAHTHTPQTCSHTRRRQQERFVGLSHLGRATQRKYYRACGVQVLADLGDRHHPALITQGQIDATVLDRNWIVGPVIIPGAQDECIGRWPAVRGWQRRAPVCQRLDQPKPSSASKHSSHERACEVGPKGIVSIASQGRVKNSWGSGASALPLNGRGKGWNGCGGKGAVVGGLRNCSCRVL